MFSLRRSPPKSLRVEFPFKQPSALLRDPIVGIIGGPSYAQVYLRQSLSTANFGRLAWRNFSSWI